MRERYLGEMHTQTVSKGYTTKENNYANSFLGGSSLFLAAEQSGDTTS